MNRGSINGLKEMKWLILLVTALAMGSNISALTLTEEEKAAGWELLFDGTTQSIRDNFVDYQENNPSNTNLTLVYRSVDDSIMQQTNQTGAEMRTKKKYGNFALEFEYKIDGNQGVMYRSTLCGNSAWRNSVEYAIDREGHNDRTHGGAAYDMWPIENNFIPSTETSAWNTAKIVAIEDSVMHYHNEKVTAGFSYWSDYFQEGWVVSKFDNGYPEFATQCENGISQNKQYVSEGYIVIQQGHGGTWNIKNFKVLVDPVLGCSDSTKAGYVPGATYDVSSTSGLIGDDQVSFCGADVPGGCKDPAAANYNAAAQWHDPLLCVGTGIDNVMSHDQLAAKFSIYSETNLINIRSDGTEPYNLEILDIAGKKVYTEKNLRGQTEVPGLQQGLYFMKVLSEGAQFTRRITVF